MLSVGGDFDDHYHHLLLFINDRFECRRYISHTHTHTQLQKGGEKIFHVQVLKILIGFIFNREIYIFTISRLFCLH